MEFINKYHFLLVALSIALVTISCSDSIDPSECDGYEAEEYIESGFVYTESNYGELATSCYYTDYGQGNPAADSIVMYLTNYQHCTQKSGLTLRLEYAVNDTVFLNSDERLIFVDYDIYYGSYSINQDFNNWLLVTSLSDNNRVLNAEFELSFVKPTIEVQIPRDDPNRPDTLYFTNGLLISDYMFF